MWPCQETGPEWGQGPSGKACLKLKASLSVPCPLWLSKAILRTDMSLGPTPHPMPCFTRLPGTAPAHLSWQPPTPSPARSFPLSALQAAAHLCCGLGLWLTGALDPPYPLPR